MKTYEQIIQKSFSYSSLPSIAIIWFYHCLQWKLYERSSVLMVAHWDITSIVIFYPY